MKAKILVCSSFLWLAIGCSSSSSSSNDYYNGSPLPSYDHELAACSNLKDCLGLSASEIRTRCDNIKQELINGQPSATPACIDYQARVQLYCTVQSCPPGTQQNTFDANLSQCLAPYQTQPPTACQ